VVNLLSITSIKDPKTLGEYLSYLSTKLKDHEMSCLKSLCRQLQKEKAPAAVFDKYHMGYSIPQISKEFDNIFYYDDSGQLKYSGRSNVPYDQDRMVSHSLSTMEYYDSTVLQRRKVPWDKARGSFIIGNFFRLPTSAYNKEQSLQLELYLIK